MSTLPSSSRTDEQMNALRASLVIALRKMKPDIRWLARDRINTHVLRLNPISIDEIDVEKSPCYLSSNTSHLSIL
jgi:hypothetical protein